METMVLGNGSLLVSSPTRSGAPGRVQDAACCRVLGWFSTLSICMQADGTGECRQSCTNPARSAEGKLAMTRSY